MKNDYRRDRRQVSLVVDSELWFLVKRSAAAEGLSVTAWVTALLEDGVHVGDGAGWSGGGGVVPEGGVAGDERGRVGDGVVERGVAGRRGVEHIPGWAVPIVAARGDASSGIVAAAVERDPLEEIA